MEPLLAFRAGTPGAVTTGAAAIGGRQVVVARFDLEVRRGALHPADGETLALAAETALASRLPLVVTLASSGADVTEGLPSVHGWGVAARRITACSGIVPIVIAVIGPAVSGPALLLGLADQVVMTEEAYAFLSGPSMVQSFTGVAIDKEELGGAVVHGRWTGLASLVVPDEAAARESVEHLLSYLPSHADEMPPERPTDDPVARLTP